MNEQKRLAPVFRKATGISSKYIPFVQQLWFEVPHHPSDLVYLYYDSQGIIYIFSLFLIFSAFGTILHECGHFIPAYLYGWEPTLHYGQTSLSVAIPASPALNNWKVLSYHVGGMMVNISIGSIGYIILKKQHHLLKNEHLKAFLIVLTFFGSRQIVILISDLRELVYDSPILTDEQKVSLQLSLPKNSLSILLGVIAIYLCYNGVFKFLPRQSIIPFCVSGLIGSVLGYLFWFRILGPNILP